MNISYGPLIPNKLHRYISQALLMVSALFFSNSIHAFEATDSNDALYQSCIEQDTGFGKMNDNKAQVVCSCVVRRAVESNLNAEVKDIVSGYFKVKKLDKLQEYWMQDMNADVFEQAIGFTEKIASCREEDKLSFNPLGINTGI